jgi:HK97 family phage portal protein
MLASLEDIDLGIWDKIIGSRKKPAAKEPARVEPEWTKHDPLIVIKTASGGSLYDDSLQREGGAPRGQRALSLYAASSWLYAGARLIAQSIASVPVQVFLDDEPAPDDDLLVRLLKRPAPKWSYNRMAQASALYQVLTGSVFWQKVRADRGMPSSSLVANERVPAQIWPFGEDSYTAETAQEGLPLLTHYTNYNGESESPMDVIQSMFIRPGYGFEDEGLGPAEAGMSETETDLAASQWQRCTLANRAVPDGVLKLKKLATSTPQYDAIVKKLEDSWSGALNAGRPLVLGQEVDWMALARSAVEMDLQNGRIQTRQSILAPIGVPPVLVGDLSKATYNNYQTALLSFWTLTVLPLHDIWLDAWNTELAPEYGSEYSIRRDDGLVDALIPMVKARWELSEIMGRQGVSLEERNRILRLGLEPSPAWDVGFIASSSIPMDAFGGVDDV